jgi:hypothetical protein
MKKLLIICLLSHSFLLSQTQKEMLDAGIKDNVVKTIFKKFDGNLTSAIYHWASNGNTKLSKEFIESAYELGYDPAFLDIKLKEARKSRTKTAIIGTLAIGVGVASGLAGAGGSDYSSIGNSFSDYSSLLYDKRYSNTRYKPLKMEKLKSETSLDYQYDRIDELDFNGQNNSVYNEYLNSLSTADEIENKEEIERFIPVFYGETRSYIDGINDSGTGFDPNSGTLNVYSSDGMTIGSVKKDDGGYALYKEGIPVSYTTNQDNYGVSTTYVDGIPVSAKKYDKKGNITYFKDGIRTGYSKKVRDGYEHYDKNGHIVSFTNVE